MARVTRLLSSVLLAVGMVLVFMGLSAALGFTLPGMIASIAAVAALLFAGGVWFGRAPGIPAAAGAETVLVFDRDLKIASGGAAGTSILHQFPHALRSDLEQRCRAALAGESSRFACDVGGRRIVFDVAPVATASPIVLYGILVTGSGAPAPAVTRAPAATVA